MRQSARGESDSVIFGPSGTQLRLYCAVRNLLRNLVNVSSITSCAYSPAKAISASSRSVAAEAPSIR